MEINDKTNEQLEELALLHHRIAELEKENSKKTRMEKKLEQEEHMRSILLDNLPCVALILKKGTREIIASNEAARRIGAVPGKTCFQTCAQRDDPCPFCDAPKVWASGEKGEVEVEYRGAYYRGIWVPYTDDLFVHYIFDITERKQAEEELRRSKLQLVGIINNSLSNISVKDLNGCYFMVNSTFERHFGIDRKDIIGKTDFDLLPKEVAEAFWQEDQDIIKTGKSIEREDILKWDGKNMYFIITKFPLLDTEGSPYAVCIMSTDISERKKAEEEQQKMQKLESIGTLAGGIAHDFNNLLAAIRNNIYLSKMHVDNESAVFESLESTENIIHRATNLTQQLLTFARGGAPVKKTASIIELVKESSEFVLRGSNVKCEYNVADNIWPVEVDEGQMNQVIHNLILNANQSMPEGGTIQISIENSELDLGAGLPLQEGRYVITTVQDRGTGIKEEHLKTIFDPYFTTKEMGRGLGLSIVYSIVKAHAGYISVESETGVGTTFTIYLPASEKKIEEKEIEDDTFIAGEGKILLMDDEEIIRETAEQLLTYKGYTVECAKDGEEAIELYKKAMIASEPFDAVILDLTVRGGMGGKEAIRRLLEIDPNVKAIVASGYSNDPVLANFSAYGFSGVFAKHDKTEELGKTLHQVINGYQ